MVVTVDVLDSSGSPLAGVQITLNGVTGVSDALGRVVLQGVQQGVGIVEVDPKWLVSTRSTSGPVLPPTQQRLLVLEQSCPGTLTVRDEDSGALVEGARIVTWRAERTASGRIQLPLFSDDLGQIRLTRRPCGAARFTLRLPDGTVYTDVGTDIRGSAPAELLLPALRAGVLQVMDEDGFPIPAFIEDSELIVSLEEEGIGRHWISSRRARISVVVNAEGYPLQRVEVPLAGGVYRHVLSEPRLVDVLLACDDCPSTLRCGEATCWSVTSARFRCPCPEGDASITESLSSPVLGTAPASLDVVSLDLRGGVSLRGQWIGALPCEVWVRYDHGEPSRQRCDDAGRFSFSGLRAGAVTVQIQGRGEEAAHTLRLAGGDAVDMGQLWPDVSRVTGRIESDFPLRDARLSSHPHGRASLDASSGWFVLEGLPGGAEVIELRLESLTYGTFQERFMLSASEEVLWSVSWGGEASSRDTGGWGDDAEDSGIFDSDTGWSDVWDSGL